MELLFTGILGGFILVIQKSGSNLDNEAQYRIEIYSKISRELLRTNEITFGIQFKRPIQGMLNVSHDSLTDNSHWVGARIVQAQRPAH